MTVENIKEMAAIRGRAIVGVKVLLKDFKKKSFIFKLDDKSELIFSVEDVVGYEGGHLKSCTEASLIWQKPNKRIVIFSKI